MVNVSKTLVFQILPISSDSCSKAPLMSLVLPGAGNIVTSGKLLISTEVVDIPLIASVPQFGDLLYLLFVSLCYLFANSIRKAFVIIFEAVVSKISGKI